MEFFGFDQVNVENDIAVLTSQHILSQVVDPSRLTNTDIYIGRVNEQLRFNDDYTEDLALSLKTQNNYLDIGMLE